MKAWQIRGANGIDKLQRVELPEPAPAAGQMVASMCAALTQCSEPWPAPRQGSWLESRQRR